MIRALIPGIFYTPQDLLPQSGEMLLLDTIDGYGADWITAGLTIRRDSFGAGADGVPGWIGIEYLAQTAAAYGGIEHVQAGQQPGIALLLGARRYDCSAPIFEIGMKLALHASLILQQDDGLCVLDCDIQSNSKRLAQAQIKAYRPPDIHEFLRTQPQ